MKFEIGQESRGFADIWYYIRINGETIHEIKNESPVAIDGLQLYASDAKYNPASSVTIRGWKYRSEPGFCLKYSAFPIIVSFFSQKTTYFQ